MTTPRDYRDYALECLKWSEQTTNASQRQTLVDLARLWMSAADRLDHATEGPTHPALVQELRAKLD